MPFYPHNNYGQYYYAHFRNKMMTLRFRTFTTESHPGREHWSWLELEAHALNHMPWGGLRVGGWGWKRGREIGHRCERHYKRGIKRLDLRGKEELAEVTEDFSLCDRRIMITDRSEEVQWVSNWGKERSRVEMSSVSDMPRLGLKILREIAGSLWCQQSSNPWAQMQRKRQVLQQT